jgi:hypothetical protein
MLSEIESYSAYINIQECGFTVKELDNLCPRNKNKAVTITYMFTNPVKVNPFLSGETFTASIRESRRNLEN